MSIDIGITVGVGFIISDGTWAAIEEAATDRGEDLFGQEHFEQFETLTAPEGLLTYGSGFDQMTGDSPDRYFVGVRRLTAHIDGKHPDKTGIFPLTTVITVAEREALAAAAAEIGEPAPIITAFYAVSVF